MLAQKGWLVSTTLRSEQVLQPAEPNMAQLLMKQQQFLLFCREIDVVIVEEIQIAGPV